MDADPSIECGVPGGPNARMRPIAMLCIAWFVLGLPIAFSAFLWWNREAVREDQRMRERGEGDTAFTNPHFQVRHRDCIFVRVPFSPTQSFTGARVVPESYKIGLG